MAAAFDAVEGGRRASDLHGRAGHRCPGTGAETMDQPVSRRRAVTALVAAAWEPALSGCFPAPCRGRALTHPGTTAPSRSTASPSTPSRQRAPRRLRVPSRLVRLRRGRPVLPRHVRGASADGEAQVILEDDVFIGQDDNSGGGSEAGLDASETYDLSTALEGFEQHPQQGWHVKLTVNNDGSQGADVKHKVFWVTGCEVPPPTTTPTAPTTTTTEEPTTTTSESTTTTSESTTTTTEKRRRRRRSTRPRPPDDWPNVPRASARPTAADVPPLGFGWGAVPRRRLRDSLRTNVRRTV